MVVYLYQQNDNTMKLTKEQIKIREEWRQLNLEINGELNRLRKPLSQMPDDDWKKWMIEKIKYRDSLTPLF